MKKLLVLMVFSLSACASGGYDYYVPNVDIVYPYPTYRYPMQFRSYQPLPPVYPGLQLNVPIYQQHYTPHFDHRYYSDDHRHGHYGRHRHHD